jgi:DNA-binding transcriptional LysR family regulator
VLDYARRFENLRLEMENSLAELRDNSAGTLTVGANESTSLYLLRHIEKFRRLHPKINVRVRRSLSSKIPNELLDGNLELGVISYDPPDERLTSTVIYTDALAFVVSPKHRLAGRKAVSITDLAAETFIAHNVISPYRDVVIRAFLERRVPLNMPVEMPTIETIRKLVQNNQGVAFLPRMCVEQEIEQGLLREVKVKELHVERKIRLIYPTRRVLSHASTPAAGLQTRPFYAFPISLTEFGGWGRVKEHGANRPDPRRHRRTASGRRKRRSLPSGTGGLGGGGIQAGPSQ